jgi:hypothetical protein
MPIDAAITKPFAKRMMCSSSRWVNVPEHRLEPILRRIAAAFSRGTDTAPDITALQMESPW